MLPGSQNIDCPADMVHELQGTAAHRNRSARSRKSAKSGKSYTGTASKKSGAKKKKTKSGLSGGDSQKVSFRKAAKVRNSEVKVNNCGGVKCLGASIGGAASFLICPDRSIEVDSLEEHH